jgi:transcriptional regulator with XRE-family HTH domain
MTFGQFLRERRLALGLSLREFCLRHGRDPSNWSKLERGTIPPTTDEELLEEWATNLELQKYSADWYTFFDLAAAEQGRIPRDLLADEELVQKLPVFFRTLRGQKPTEEEIEKVLNLLRKHG